LIKQQFHNSHETGAFARLASQGLSLCSLLFLGNTPPEEKEALHAAFPFLYEGVSPRRLLYFYTSNLPTIVSICIAGEYEVELGL
jgi:hypothetical protein